MRDPWEPLRRGERIGWVLWLSYLPGTIVVGWFASKALGTEIAYLGVGFVWMGAIALLTRWLGSFVCPRCGQNFYRVWWYQGSGAHWCAHCGLTKYTDVSFDS